MTDNNQEQIVNIVTDLRKRSGLTFEKIRWKIADYLNIGDYDKDTFNRKFRRMERNPRYELDEVIALIKSFVENVSDEDRCTAYEGIELFNLTRMSIDDYQELKALFPVEEYASSWEQYLTERNLPSGAVSTIHPGDGLGFVRPNIPDVFVGRNNDIDNIKKRLGIMGNDDYIQLTIVRGWPGVGKTTLIHALLNDESLKEHFEHILWVSLGPQGNVFDALKRWARQLGALHIEQLNTVSDVINALKLIIQDLNILIIVDDIWQDGDGSLIKRLASDKNTILLTTRFRDIADSLADVKESVYWLEVLKDDESFRIIDLLAPSATKQYHEKIWKMIKTLEGLPLALNVAGHLIREEVDMGFDVNMLIDDLIESFGLIEQKAPEDRFEEDTGTTPTIRLLFQRSVETLKYVEQEAFMYLGAFAYKPATFDVNAMQSVWNISRQEATPIIRAIVGRGLLEPVKDDEMIQIHSSPRFLMHYTLSMYAQKLLDESS